MRTGHQANSSCRRLDEQKIIARLHQRTGTLQKGSVGRSAPGPHGPCRHDYHRTPKVTGMISVRPRPLVSVIGGVLIQVYRASAKSFIFPSPYKPASL
jgi:hypothetical protein